VITFDNTGAAREGISDLPWRDLPAHLQARFRALRSSPSPVDQISGLGEFIYANRKQMPDEFVEVGAALIAYANVNAWHELQQNQRGDRIVQALRRDSGEAPPAGMEWPDAETDPRPREAMIIDPPTSAAGV
jgi:hypothetical protein